MSCQICGNDYDSIEHRPYLIVPCCHSYCINCLNKLIKQQCPRCNVAIEQIEPLVSNNHTNEVYLNYFQHGNKQKNLNNFNSAIQMYNKCIESNPKFVPVYKQKGNILNEM